MSDFIESEAEESEEEFEEKDLKPKKTQRFMEEDGEIWVVTGNGGMGTCYRSEVVQRVDY